MEKKVEEERGGGERKRERKREEREREGGKIQGTNGEAQYILPGTGQAKG